jgi:PKHD-type hydroxylase
MAHLATWHTTGLPLEIINILEKDIQVFEDSAETSKLSGNDVDKVIRNSKNAWIPTQHWMTGWLWYYISKSNRENFCYDLTDIDNGSIQYTQYGEGDYYDWHIDGGMGTCFKPQTIPHLGGYSSQDDILIKGEFVRKLSFSLQLSDPQDYVGGEFQIMDEEGKSFFAPKQKGTMIIFDSRAKHRVRKVKSGVRKSLVGWVVGPRWK